MGDSTPGDGEGPDGETGGIDPRESGETGDVPPVSEKPYKLLFEANRCIGTGKCATVAANWTTNLETGLVEPRSFFLDEADLAENVAAAEACPAKKGAGVIHVVDRRTGEEVAPDPHGDGTVSVDW